MARPRKYVIKLTDDELKTLKSIIRKSNTSKTIRSRCQIIIDLDEAHGKVLTHEQSARSNGVCLTTVTNTVTKYFSGGIEAVTEFKRNINSDNARRILDGRAEARIIELACGPVPEWCCIIKVDTLFSRILIYNHNQYENRRKTYGTESKIL